MKNDFLESWLKVQRNLEYFASLENTRKNKSNCK